MKLQNRVSLVIGGAADLGRATALALAGEGAVVVVSDLDIAGGEETTHLLKAAGHQAMFIPCDVTHSRQLESLVRRTVSSLGRLDCAVNAATISGDTTPTDLREEASWDSLLDVNLKGTWLCMKYELAQMLNQSGGVIVNVGSSAGLRGMRYQSAYAASMHGIIGLARSAALEYARKNIRVNVVCPAEGEPAPSAGKPAPLLTHQAIPALPLDTVDEIAGAIVWLCSDDSSFLTGHALTASGNIDV